MAVFTGSPTSASEYLAYINGSGSPKVAGLYNMERRHWQTYTHTAAAGSGTGEINLIVLPPGKLRIYPDSSRLVTSQFGAAATISLGFRAYRQPDGTVVAENAAAFVSAGAAGAGALDIAWVLPAVGFLEVNVDGPGLILFATIAAGNIDATDTIDGWADFTRIG